MFLSKAFVLELLEWFVSLVIPFNTAQLEPSRDGLFGGSTLSDDSNRHL